MAIVFRFIVAFDRLSVAGGLPAWPALEASGGQSRTLTCKAQDLVTQARRDEERDFRLEPLDQRPHGVDVTLFLGANQHAKHADRRQSQLAGDGSPARLIDEDCFSVHVQRERKRLGFAQVQARAPVSNARQVARSLNASIRYVCHNDGREQTPAPAELCGDRRRDQYFLEQPTQQVKAGERSQRANRRCVAHYDSHDSHPESPQRFQIASDVVDGWAVD